MVNVLLSPTAWFIVAHLLNLKESVSRVHPFPRCSAFMFSNTCIESQTLDTHATYVTQKTDITELDSAVVVLKL